jgi:hypothetical protein
MQLHRVVVEWSGPSVTGRAVNVLHYAGSEEAAPDVAAIRSAYVSLVSHLPNQVKIQVPSSGETIEDTTGELLSVWSGASTTVVTGGTVNEAAAGVGACVGWTTGGVIDGRRLRGRTFVVPLHGQAYDNSGTLSVAALAGVQTFAAGLMGAGPLAVWHRPTTVGGSDGNSYGVIANQVRDKVAYLSSRRD